MRTYFYRVRKEADLLKTSGSREKCLQLVVAAKQTAALILFVCAQAQLDQLVTAPVVLAESVHDLCDERILAHLARQWLVRSVEQS